MNNIWSDNKYINLSVNILLFLTGINFLHYGQLILPVICFLLFVDNKLKFYVNNPKTFVVLCLFAVSFYAFSYHLGFYSVMGFTLPMAYYIGSNIKYPSQSNIKKSIYLFGLSMCFHIILNSIYEYIVHGHHGFFMSTTHYDFWTKEKIANTATAVNIDIMLGCLYYLIFHEKEKRFKVLNLSVLTVSMFYLLVIGRRTPVIMIVIVMGLSFLYEFFILRSGDEKTKKVFLVLCFTCAAVVALFVLAYSLNLFGCQKFLDEYHIIQKFKKGFMNDQRFELYFGSFALMPKYPWGGQHISAILGDQVHDFWIDIYDYAGIISCTIMIVYSVVYLVNIIRVLRWDFLAKDFRILVLGVMICIILQMFFEPVMTGSSLFVIVAIIINAILERQLIDGQ